MKDWHLVENIPVRWLVDGLLPADGFSAVIGKPKAGKSTFIRQLIAAVIKSQPFLDRAVNIPTGTGTVLYIHLDRKDKPARVVEELRRLGITSDDEVSRLTLMVAEDLPVANLETPANSFADRLCWLKKQVELAKPDLIVIDLLQQFVCSPNVNDYAEALTSVNRLQDALTNIGYQGALLVALHSRKATNSEQPFDDALGSTAYRGSFTTLVLLKQNRAEGRYTITSDQTEREDPWGEIDETELVRNPDGTLSLGRPVAELKEDKKTAKMEADIERVLLFINDHPDSETDEIISSLAMAKGRFLEIVRTINDLLVITGRGIKGEPRRYSLKSFGGSTTHGDAHGDLASHCSLLDEEPVPPRVDGIRHLIPEPAGPSEPANTVTEPACLLAINKHVDKHVIEPVIAQANVYATVSSATNNWKQENANQDIGTVHSELAPRLIPPPVLPVGRAYGIDVETVSQEPASNPTSEAIVTNGDTAGTEPEKYTTMFQLMDTGGRFRDPNGKVISFEQAKELFALLNGTVVGPCRGR